MKASELLLELQKGIDEHGDHDVVLVDWNEDYAEPSKTISVTFNSAQFLIGA